MDIDTGMDADGQGVAELMAGVAAAVPPQAVSADVFQAIVREIPQLEEDKPLLGLLASSVNSNVDMCLQIMQHRIDLSAVRAPAAAVEYARRLAQRGTPVTTRCAPTGSGMLASSTGCSRNSPIMPMTPR